MALFEVIVALTIFSIAALSATVWVRQVVLTVEQAAHAADDARRASDYMDVIALWPREDLDRHLGERRQGIWLVQVRRPAPTIYDVMIFDSTGSRALVRTSLCRQESRL